MAAIRHRPPLFWTYFPSMASMGGIQVSSTALPPLDETVFSSVCRFDDGIYTGTLVDHRGHAWEFFADLNDPQNCDLEDVTDTLGPKSPDHPQADLCDKVTMALLYQREQQLAA